MILFPLKASSVVRVAFLSSWSLEDFGAEYYERVIEALASDTLVEMLKLTVKPKPKKVTHQLFLIYSSLLDYC